MKKFFQINQYIKSDKLRVIDNNGDQLGVMTKIDALKKAQSESLDLVLVAEKAEPPVARIVDFTKFKYQQSKKERSGTAKSKATNVKEVRLTPFMAKNDFERRIERANDFLKDGYRTKLVVKFVGRQITRREFGRELMDDAIAKLAEVGTAEGEPKWQGKLLIVQFKPKQQPKQK